MDAMDPIPQHGRYDADQFEALQALVAHSPGAFSLNLAICSDTTLRTELVKRLQDEFPTIELISFWPYSSDLFEHVHTRMTPEPKDALFVIGLEDALGSGIDRAELLATLNSSPPRWKAWFACPVVFWVNAKTADMLREESKDFWEWQTGLFRIDA